MGNARRNATKQTSDLLERLGLAAILLDSDLRVSVFTTVATGMLAPVDDPAGRPLAEVKLSVDAASLVLDAQRALSTSSTVTRELEGVDGGRYRVRTQPFATTGSIAAGVAITMTDITARPLPAHAARCFTGAVRPTKDAPRVDSDQGGVLPGKHGAKKLCGGTQHPQATDTVNAELSNRLRAEQALHESQERIKAILNTAAEGIISINWHGIIDSFNPAAERLFGYAAIEVIGKNVSLLMPSSERDKHEGYLTSYLKTGQRRVIGIGREVEGQRKDGTLFPIDLAIGEGADGDGPFFVGILRDLTARKDSENRLRTAERLAAIGTLAAGLGHDMNNVLLPVRARLNALSAAGESGAMRTSERRHTAAITRSIAYLQQLADGLHYLAMDPDAGDIDQASTDLHRWWRKAGALLSKSVAKNVKLTASIPVGLPPVGVAPHKLTQALLNLLVNAGEAISSSGFRRKGRIEVWARAAKDSAVGPCVKLGVTDNGRGMSAEVRAHALDMFFTTKPRGLGTGLGLPLVRKTAEQVGGVVQIESKEGKGAKVSLVLPARGEPARVRTSRRAGARAMITVGDGRAASLVQQMLVADGLRVSTGDCPGGHDIWVVEPQADRLKTAIAWKARCPDSRLVLFGDADTLSRAGWMECRPIVIHDRYDFKQVRSALSLASLCR